MKRYNKYIIKDMRYLLRKLLAIVLIVILGVGFSVGLLTAAPNMRFSIERYYRNTNAADLIVQSPMPFKEDTLNKFKENELIDEAFGYFSFDEDVLFRNGERLAKINVLDFRKEIPVNKLTLVEGRFPNPDSDVIEIVIERKQPFLIDVPIGYETMFYDTLVKVVGIVDTPWYFAFVEEISQVKQRPIEIIIYADQGLLTEVEYTHIAATLKDTNDRDIFSEQYEDFVISKVDQLKLDFDSFYYTTRNLNQSFAKYKSDVKIVEAIALIFPVFFLLVTILVSMASITRIVEDQRNQIGTLRSLGYGNFRIMGKYILYALISSGLGVVIGIGLGIYFIPAVVYNAYETIYNLPVFSIQYYFSYTSLISFLMIISVVIVTISAVASALKEKPTDLLRVKTQKPGKKIILERISFLWKRLKFKYKSTFRNIFRHKKHLILTLIGIGGSTALLLAGFGIKDSVDLAGKYQFEEMMNYDLEININANGSLIEEIENFNYIYAMATNTQYSNKDYISVLVLENSINTNDFIKFRDLSENPYNFKTNSVVVTNQFAMKHNLKKGDNLELKIADEEFVFKITNIQEYYFGNQIYIAKELVEDKIDLDFNKIFVRTNIFDSKIKEKLGSDLRSNNKVAKVMFEEDLKYSFENTSESMNSIIIVLVVAASALAIIINYNLILINIHTRRREIATLKVLGYQEKEVSGYVFRETLLISIVAILIGLILGKTLHFFIIQRIVIDGVLLNNKIWWPSYIYTILLSSFFLIIVYFLSVPQTRKIDMIDALKSYE